MNQATADKKFMVVLSDGVPTYSYGLNNPRDYLTEFATRRWETTTGAPESAYLYANKVGNGMGIRWQFDTWREYFLGPVHTGYYNHGNSAIAEAGFAKTTDDIQLYTVGLQTDATGSAVLNSMASPGSFYEVTDVSQLTPVFEAISATILKATNEAKVDTEFNEGFLLPAGFTTGESTTSPGSTVEIVDGKPIWHIGTVSNPLDETNHPGVKYEYLTFKVTINDDILTHADPTDVNPLAEIRFEYKDQDGEPQSIGFPEARVNPKLYIIEKNVAVHDSVDHDRRTFDIIVNEPDGTIHETIEVRHGQRKILNNLTKGATYNVFEGTTGKAYNAEGTYFEPFTIADYYNNQSISFDGNPVAGEIQEGGLTPPAPVTIKEDAGGDQHTIIVTNEEIANKAIVTITKQLEKLTRASRNVLSALPVNQKFDFTLSSPDMDNDIEFTLEADESITIADIGFYQYTLTEDTTDIAPFAPKDGEQGKTFTISLYDVLSNPEQGKLVYFVNTYDTDSDDNKVTVEATKKWSGGNSEDRDDAVIDLYSQINGGERLKVAGATPVVTEVDATTFTYTWDNLPKINDDGKLITYSVEEAGVIDGKVTINDRIYRVTQDGNTITNTYVISQTDDLLATKTWHSVNDPDVTKPDILFELWRSGGAAGAGERVAGPTALKEDKVNFGPQDQTDANGVDYTYYVKEVFADPEDVLNQNWVVTEDGMTVTNRTIKDIDDEDNPGDEDEKIAALTVKKVVSGRVSSNRTFTFRVTGPYGMQEELVLRGGESKTLENLYFGDYQVRELTTAGFNVRYAPAEGKVQLNKDEPEDTVVVTNTSRTRPPRDDDDDGTIVTPPDLDPVKPPTPETPELIKDDHFAYMFGYPGDIFWPERDMTRAEVTAMFSRLMVRQMQPGKTYPNNYTDVPEGTWYYDVVGYMTDMGIIVGYEDGSFRPDGPVTRAEFAAIASRYDAIQTYSPSHFSDVPETHWAKNAIDRAASRGWVSGYPDGTFMPEQHITRAEVVAVTNRMLVRYGDEDFITKYVEDLVLFTDIQPQYWAYIDIREATNGHEFERKEDGRNELWLRLK